MAVALNKTSVMPLREGRNIMTIRAFV